MKRMFAALLALACVVGSTPGFARGAGSGMSGGSGHGFARGVDPGFVEPLSQIPESRIPAPLAAPEQAPIINGPISQPALRGL
jgi:hypothetical protein